MTDRVTLLRWAFWGLLVAISAGLLFVRLLPLDLSAGRFPGPDIFMAFVMAWMLRRPDYVPIFLVAMLIFLTDLMYQDIPAVGALMAVIGLEVLRRREPGLREQPFLIELGVVAAVLLGMLLGERILLMVFFVEQIPVGRALLQFLTTIAIYPLVVFLSVFVLGVQKLQPGDDPVRRQAA
ncbi:rod shape-determining protein MreD [Aliiroseovarius halocynthiae]|uniref:Rod shape-determining protein MreD n=1 Tax=Aliiroseovarius halocynthiae TaxID=985055 RepID=A0A545SRF9_9RHOB|nr:rod shape-determining protein MreD [Aliiroseovarius halocynthiae]TQV67537.1 rod shape-determining protein MreD [Aliiroseovarius halocynthiae]SMR81549.1 rod shape-determining protein MreD [Aliiroseovarius halocynthiae]